MTDRLLFLRAMLGMLNLSVVALDKHTSLHYDRE